MNKDNWTAQASAYLYHMQHWGGMYFDVNPNGDLCVFPRGREVADIKVNLRQLAREIHEAGLPTPVLVRFADILHHRIDLLDQAFQQAMEQADYQARYTAIYPIKVNQQRHVVDEILDYGRERVGLEAGSKPELLAVLALAPKNSLIICNGYKDREYIRLALIGQRLGLRPHLVIEKASELKLIIEESRTMGITPHLGVRVRLASLGSGNWENTGGEKGKFGLSSAQVLQVVEQLSNEGLLNSLVLLHFHMGSQLSNIQDIQRGLREAARYFAQLHQLGVPLHTIDVGGGLGVDYDGSHSRGHHSINYSVQEYAHNIVRSFAEVCAESDLPHPHVITECGRAMTAHHAVFITNVTDVEPAPGEEIPEPAREDEPLLIQDLWRMLEELDKQHSATEAYHNAVYWLSEVHGMFSHGVLSLAERARAEKLYFALCHRVRKRLQPSSRSQREILDELNEKLADKYFCNFSLFQSAPDAWAIEQLFPIVPLQRLHEYPARRAILQDLTCDSDGKFERYVDAEGLETSLPVHALHPGEEYLLGFFLVGAYQEILGDMHNLFGDTHAINVEIAPDGNYRLVEPELGDTVQDMLRYVHFDVDNLRDRYRHKLQAAELPVAEQLAYLDELQAGLQGYTYLE